MKAIKVDKETSNIHFTDVEKPSIENDELLVEVKASGVNRLDLIHRERLSDVVLGVETAGVVVQAGDQATAKVGDRVMGLTSTGGYADYAVINDKLAMEVPENLTFQQAAAIPEVFLTAFQTLYLIGKLNQGEKVLIHAGGSGVGTAAIQLARELSQAEIFTTAGSQEKLDFIKDLGANHTINYKKESFSDYVLKETEGQGVNLILDFIGADYYHDNIKSVAIDGRIVLIGTLSGGEVDGVDLQELLNKRIQLTGTLLSPRSLAYKQDLVDQFKEAALDLFKDQPLKPIINKVFPLNQAQEAHDYMKANKNIGKIILEPEE